MWAPDKVYLFACNSIHNLADYKINKNVKKKFSTILIYMAKVLITRYASYDILSTIDSVGCMINRWEYGEKDVRIK